MKQDSKMSDKKLSNKFHRNFLVKSFLERTIIAFILAFLFIFSIFFYRPIFYVLISIIGLLMYLEWYKTTKRIYKYNILGIFLVAIFVISLFTISMLDVSGWILLFYFVTIWATDTLAMICGKMIGGMKLVPKISPNKTISGLLGGVFGSAIMVLLLMKIFKYNINDLNISYIGVFVYTLFISCFSQVSDIFMSYFKRKFDAKDFGTILLSHGGVLDRFDGFLLTAPTMLITMLFLLKF